MSGVPLIPELDELLALRAAAGGLSLRAHRPALARLQGGRASAQRGRGLEFEEVRPYAAGDDARSIDWRVTARRGKPHTKLFREERERPVLLVLDLHPGQFFGSRRQLKSALMLRAAALLGWVAVRDGDRLGVVVHGGDGLRALPPRARQAGILPVLEALVEAQPRAPGTPRGNALQQALDALQGLKPQGALVVVISDFAGLAPLGSAALSAVAGRCDLRLLWITDPLEASGLPAGDFRVGLPGRLWRIDGRRTQAAWQAAWTARQQGLAGLAQQLRLPLTQLSTADAVEHSLPALLREPRWAA